MEEGEEGEGGRDERTMERSAFTPFSRNFAMRDSITPYSGPCEPVALGAAAPNPAGGVENKRDTEEELLLSIMGEDPTNLCMNWHATEKESGAKLGIREAPGTWGF